MILIYLIASRKSHFYSSYVLNFVCLWGFTSDPDEKAHNSPSYTLVDWGGWLSHASPYNRPVGILLWFALPLYHTLYLQARIEFAVYIYIYISLFTK